MKKTKFIVKVNHPGTHAAEYVQRIDRAPIRMTTDRKLALLMDDSRPKTLSDPFTIPSAPGISTYG